MPKQIIMKIQEILDFVNPPNEQHSPSLYYMLLLAEYGPLHNGGIVGGDFKNQRVLTKHELRPMLKVYEQKTQQILEQVKYKERLHHTLNYEIVDLFDLFSKKLPKKQLNYDHKLTAESQLTFDDFCQMMELFYESIIKNICK